MNEEEIKLALFGVGITMAFLSIRIIFDWEDGKINFKIRRKR